ncbi:MAG TPA: 1,4-dihydroxy-2-naphthoate octaprenyltransferase [Saprospirales bacterium]|nr:1,4-dihydroxy-2-naphthoate octaprenyltransferase [Saprospirales bacterium]HAY71457.1 1,4-dihydroxy-2-naphthoate octaprenyltransferase [Saprospirales bacterium]HRQ30332.1 1,4-dihydroxy-2-naphthoate polyprenyltransferase [Saprospiraceae bacterium]
MNSTIISNWIGAMRLRTLPLALAGITMGAFLAWFYGAFNLPVFILAVMTALFLQILSNLANDLGDSLHGADSADRKGPSRAVQSGKITTAEMKTGISIFALLAISTGSALLIISPVSNIAFWSFLGLGFLAVLAAIKYTMGKKPYGYQGFGDIAVFVFFGVVAVSGSFYLQTGFYPFAVILPSVAVGTLSVAVLNVNNIRDMESDILAGKRSLAVKLGRKNAVFYHYVLLLLAVIASVFFVYTNYHSVSQYLFILAIPMFIRNAFAVTVYREQSQLDPYLRQMAVSTLIYVLLFGLGMYFSKS